MREYGLRINLEQDKQAVVNDSEFEGILEEDWLDEGDDIKCPIPSKPEGSGEPEEPRGGNATVTTDKVKKETPKDSGSFDIADLRLSQDYAESAGVKKLLTTIPVCRPNRQKFFRVNPDPAYQMQVAVVEVKEEGETYIVSPQILSVIPEEYKFKLLVVGVTRQGVLFVWPLGLPGPDGKDNPWNQSARAAAEHAETAWVRLVSNRELGAYEIYEAEGNLGSPKFPDLSMGEIINIAFKDKVISDLNHPLLQQLRGGI